MDLPNLHIDHALKQPECSIPTSSLQTSLFPSRALDSPAVPMVVLHYSSNVFDSSVVYKRFLMVSNAVCETLFRLFIDNIEGFCLQMIVSVSFLAL